MAVGNLMRGRSANIPGTSGASLGTPPNITTGPPLPSVPRSGQIRDLGGRFAGGMFSAWVGFEALAHLPEKVQEDLRHGVDNALERLQQDMVEYAQQNAPWEDITGDARAELHSPAITTSSNGDKSIILAHGVDYGIYLETMNGGQFAIIIPTIREFAGRVPQYIQDGLS